MEPSTHGPSRHFAGLQNLVAVGGIADSGQPNALKIYGFTALRTISKRTLAVLKRHSVSPAPPMLSKNARDPCREPRGSSARAAKFSCRRRRPVDRLPDCAYPCHNDDPWADHLRES